MNHVLVLAAGSSSRVGFSKVFAPLGDNSVLYHSLKAFVSLPNAGCVVVLLPPEEFEENKEQLFSKHLPEALLARVVALPGGRERAESVAQGMRYLMHEGKANSRLDNVLIHDAARCLVSGSLIERILTALKNSVAVVPVIRPADSVLSVNPDSSRGDGSSQAFESIQYLNRSQLRNVQTPQAFRFGDLFEKLFPAVDACPNLPASERTDEGSLFAEELALVEGDRTNIKITYPEDFDVAAALLAGR